MADETQQGKQDEQVIARAKKRFEQCVDSESEIRQKCLDDLEFLAASPDDPDRQWGAQELKNRMTSGRPALVVNRLDQFVQHIANAQRQNRVSARVFPVDDKADVDTAEVRQGLIRHIEYNSRADLAYDTAEFYAVAMGFGYWRLNREYCDPRSFDQDIKIERIRNPFQVYLDPGATQPDGSDAEFGFIVTGFTKDEFEQAFPDAAAASADWAEMGREHGDWCKDGCIRVVEYFEKTYKTDTLYQMQVDGQTVEVLDSEIPEGVEKPKEGAYLNKRATKIPTCKWYKLNAVEILEQTDWPIPCIPIVKVIGNELDLNGKHILKGIVRNLKDAQRQYNFMLSAQTEAIDASKGQVVVTSEALEGHEQEWADAPKRKILTVNGVNERGEPIAPPFRLQPNASIAPMTEARLMAADDLKALTSIYDAALGQKSNETSGRAILSRQQQSDTANFHFQDNLTRSISYSTHQILDMMPHVYDGARVIRIIGEDDAHDVVKINQEFDDNGQAKKYDFSVGKYDVICAAGPSFATKRKEAAETLLQLTQSMPIVGQVAADLIARSLDIPYAQEIADRIKKTLPPQLVEDENDQAALQAQQMAQQLQQENQQLNAYLQQVEEENKQFKAGAQVKQMEVESRERIEMARLQLEQQNHAAQLDSNEAIALLKAEVDALKNQMSLNAQQAAREAEAGAQQIAE